ncbi:MAG: hypothetical protein GY805_19985 [Chloroflexi bacterium]|nr:hypothetical protein [Chloroflexota bacterium]
MLLWKYAVMEIGVRVAQTIYIGNQSHFMEAIATGLMTQFDTKIIPLDLNQFDFAAQRPQLLLLEQTAVSTAQLLTLLHHNIPLLLLDGQRPFVTIISGQRIPAQSLASLQQIIEQTTVL